MAGCVPHYIEGGGIWSSCLCPSFSAFSLPTTYGAGRPALARVSLALLATALQYLEREMSCHDVVNFDGLGNEVLSRWKYFGDESGARELYEGTLFVDWLIS